MGFSISWIAAQGISFEDALTELKLTDLEEQDPDLATAHAGAIIGDWVLFYSNDFDFPTLERVAALSRGGQAIGCQIEEHVMVSSLRGCELGVQTWYLFHDGGQIGVDHLSTEGILPPAAGPIIESLKQKQAAVEANEVDYIFDAPVELGAAICGFRHDEDSSASFTALEPIYPKGWLKRLFFNY